MTQKQITQFVKKLEPKFAELLQQKISESHTNGDTMDISHLTLDVTEKMKEWLDLREEQLDTQLEIEVVLALSARLMLLWFALDKTVKKSSIANTEMIEG